MNRWLHEKLNHDTEGKGTLFNEDSEKPLVSYLGVK